MLRLLQCLAIAALLIGANADTRADDLDQDAARRAVANGELRPLSEILAAVRKEFGGKVIDVELEREDSGALVYEIEVLMPNGRVLELEYDGRTGNRISFEEGDD